MPVTKTAIRQQNGVWIPLVKSANETKANNVTLANDVALALNLLANTRYLIRGKIFFDTSAAADFKWRHTGPASPVSVRIKKWSLPPSNTLPSAVNLGVDVAYSSADNAITGTGTTGGIIELDCVIENGANAGVFAFQWAQNSSDAGNTTVLRGSYLEYKTF